MNIYTPVSQETLCLTPTILVMVFTVTYYLELCNTITKFL